MDDIKDFKVNSERWLSLEDFYGEVWKDIPNYEGLYKVSNYGRIKSLYRIVINKNGISRSYREKIMALWIGANGYSHVFLYKNGCKYSTSAHRLVATLFVANPDNLPLINHKDENPINNCFWNLEWCTHTYNMNYGTTPFRKKVKMTNRKDISVCVHQFTIDGKYIMSYPSANEAERQTGIKANNILSVCYGTKSSSAGGFIWSLTKDENEVNAKVRRKMLNSLSYKEKPVIRCSMDGKYIDEFSSISEAAKATGIHKDTISRCCKHSGYYKSAGGFKWEFKKL